MLDTRSVSINCRTIVHKIHTARPFLPSSKEVQFIHMILRATMMNGLSRRPSCSEVKIQIWFVKGCENDFPLVLGRS